MGHVILSAAKHLGVPQLAYTGRFVVEWWFIVEGGVVRGPLRVPCVFSASLALTYLCKPPSQALREVFP